MAKVIDIYHLSKHYPRQSAPALDNLTLSVEVGEIFGYLGPNGAGKTTTIRLMLDFVRPTSGNVHILGMNVNEHSVNVREQVGFLPGELALWGHMTGWDTLRYLADLRPGCDLIFAHELAERLRLDLKLRAAAYSTGNKRKLGIIQAMMHRPPLLIFDEPTNGLDPLIRHTFNDLLREAREDGQTIFLSSHVLSEVEAVCDRVAVLRGGQLQRVDHINQLKRELKRTITLFSRTPFDVGTWSSIDGVERVEDGHGFIRLTVNGSVDAVIKYAATYAIDDVQIEVAGLEQVFMEFYNG